MAMLLITRRPGTEGREGVISLPTVAFALAPSMGGGEHRDPGKEEGSLAVALFLLSTAHGVPRDGFGASNNTRQATFYHLEPPDYFIFQISQLNKFLST